MKNITPSLNERLTVNGLAHIFESFPKLNFLDKFQNYSMIDALFCGKFPKFINTENGYFGNKLDPNSFIVKIQRKLVNFLQTSLPSHKSNGRTICENITVRELRDCSNFPSLMHAKSILQGYILVTPDTPLVRSIIDDLNKPLRYANLLRDLLVDIDQVSINMQNQMEQNFLPTFISVSFRNIVFAITLFRYLRNSCTILN
jgi:hypothetical protein